MYTPRENKLEDREKIIAFMQRYPFATIVSTDDGGKPLATHLPFHVRESGDAIILTAHFAKANLQWKNLKNTLVIFQSPHAYISPKHYDKEENVPTWNYVSVHVYGVPEIVTDVDKGMEILVDMMRQSEPEFLEQWERLDKKYVAKLYKGIVPIEMRVIEIQAKHKLSQNKTVEERLRIIESLSQETDSAANDLARYMQDNERNISS